MAFSANNPTLNNIPGVSLKTKTAFSVARTAQLTLLSVAWLVGLNVFLMAIVLSYYPATAVTPASGTVSIASHLTGTESSPPVVQIFSPTFGATATTTSVNFELAVWDHSGIDSIQSWIDYDTIISPTQHTFFILATSSSTATSGPTFGTTRTDVKVVRSLETGPHFIKFRVFDHAGNFSDTVWLALNVMNNIDISPPTAYWITPQGASTSTPSSTPPSVVSGAVPLTIKAFDNKALKNISVTVFSTSFFGVFSQLGSVNVPPTLAHSYEYNLFWDTTGYDVVATSTNFLTTITSTTTGATSTQPLLYNYRKAKYPNGIYYLQAAVRDAQNIIMSISMHPVVINNPDTDGDGQIDVLDNCRLVDNGPIVKDPGGNIQFNANSSVDNYGNICDGDYDNNGVVGSTDLNILRKAFGFNSLDSNYNPAVDYDGDGMIGGQDYNFLRRVFGKPPGPSGY